MYSSSSASIFCPFKYNEWQSALILENRQKDGWKTFFYSTETEQQLKLRQNERWGDKIRAKDNRGLRMTQKKRGAIVIFNNLCLVGLKSPGMLFCLHITWYNTHTHTHKQARQRISILVWYTNSRRGGIKLEAVEIPNAHPTCKLSTHTHT